MRPSYSRHPRSRLCKNLAEWRIQRLPVRTTRPNAATQNPSKRRPTPARGCGLLATTIGAAIADALRQTRKRGLGRVVGGEAGSAGRGMFNAVRGGIALLD